MSDVVDGDPSSMFAYSQQLKAPPIPGSVTAGLATPANLSGMVESALLSVLDQAVTAEINAYLGVVTADMVTYGAKVKQAAATYSLADITSALDLATSGVKLGQKVVGVAKQVSGAAGSQSGTTDPTDTGAGDGSPQTT
ncbi:hypothetical protein [Amycolatopsis sp. BJA-103]|uniref:hypothetical protein n=1 Tax=unclassified Amycolatopsis TaxID=2618356 RepID=UPI000C774BB2|nr:hypothetical protein [Amycolatopsis sp. BJA-103]AUI60996.1 hypothetical protein BKN51_24275 [Amycolatopsis sp. BJA-103]PNE21718.1 hypothetical protein B1H26_08205 [Amycolatopsis sp. BJA-103]